MAEKKEAYIPPGAWIAGRLVDTKTAIEHYYDDEMCAFLDPSAKPTQIRSAMLNEMNAERPAPRIVTWNPALKRATSAKG